MGGSEWLLYNLAKEFARDGHEVTVRLPRHVPTLLRGGRTVTWTGENETARQFDVLFCFDDFERKDTASRTVLVACRSDPPPHTDFNAMVFLSKTHARLMGYPDAPAIGGGVTLSDYYSPSPRVPRRVIYTSSPDRGGHHAQAIGRDFDFYATYRGANELFREDLIRVQKTAKVMIHPYDAPRESEFFCMSALECLAAGTPVILSDGPALVELWGDVATILPRPIRYSKWMWVIENLLANKDEWQRQSEAGQAKAVDFAWSRQAARYLAAAGVMS
jgi:glycosyltransferase involved in cell wall biosynthesis